MCKPYKGASRQAEGCNLEICDQSLAPTDNGIHWFVLVMNIHFFFIITYLFIIFSLNPIVVY